MFSNWVNAGMLVQVGKPGMENSTRENLFRANYGTSSAAFPLWINTGTAYDLMGVNTGTLPSGFVPVSKRQPNSGVGNPIIRNPHFVLILAFYRRNLLVHLIISPGKPAIF